MIVISRLIFGREFVALAFWPFIILREGHLKTNKVLLNHEKIHLRQQAELLVLPFYLIYLSEWLIRCLIYWDRKKAYRNISFEREAFYNEENLQYLPSRNSFSFIKYF